jgi:seryl-tRNA synthetase
MKKKEEVGDTNLTGEVDLDKVWDAKCEIMGLRKTTDALSNFRSFHQQVGAEFLQTLSLGQLKAVRARLDTAMDENAKALSETERVRNEALREVGNLLHPSVPVDDNEDNNRVERTWGDVTLKKKYSHVDLIVVSRDNLS